MSRRRRRRLLVPEARAALDQMKSGLVSDNGQSVATPHSGPLFNSRHPQSDMGEMTTRQAGEMGGPIGGSMVKRLIEIAEQELAKENGGP
jgi:hypothetical protein